MKIISDLEQGSNSWLQWRQTKLTATNASVIMRMNRWQTRKELWEEKTLGWTKPFTQKELDRMAEGQRLEPLARQKFIEDTGIFINPAIGEHSDYDFIGASFDGLSSDHQFVLEIKCGKKAFEMGENGILPPYYFCQMSHQMMIADAYIGLYYCYNGERGILMEVIRDRDFEEKLLAEEIKFWDNIQSFTEPEL